MPSSADTRNGLLFIMMSAMGYASFPTLAKLIYRASEMQPLDVAFWRFAIAIPLLWLGVGVWRRVMNPPKMARPLPRVKLVLSGTLVAGAAITSLFGFKLINAGVYVVLFFTYPAIVGMITAAMGEPMPLRGWIAVVLMLMGIGLTAPEIFALDFQSAMLLGAVIALLNAAMVAVFIVVNAVMLRGYPSSVAASAWALTGTLVVILPVSVWRGGVMAPPTMGVWALMVGLSVFGTVLPYFGLMMGTKLLGANRAAIVGTVEPVLAILLAWGLLGEQMLPIQIAGSTLILLGVVILEAKGLPRLRWRKAKIAA